MFFLFAQDPVLNIVNTPTSHLFTLRNIRVYRQGIFLSNDSRPKRGVLLASFIPSADEDRIISEIEHIAATVELTNNLIDVHSQFNNLSILDSDFIFLILDSLSENQALVKEFHNNFKLLKILQKKLDDKILLRDKLNSDLDYNKFLLDEFNELEFNNINLDEIQDKIKEADNLDQIKEAVQQAKKFFADVLIIDTAGRLHVDNELMSEIRSIWHRSSPTSLIVADELCNSTEDQYDKQVYKRLKGSLVTFQRLINRIESGEDDESK